MGKRVTYLGLTTLQCSVKRFERSNGLDTAPYNNIPFYRRALLAFNALPYQSTRNKTTGDTYWTDKEPDILECVFYLLSLDSSLFGLPILFTDY